jgi:hypothetical protein
MNETIKTLRLINCSCKALKMLDLLKKLVFAFLIFTVVCGVFKQVRECKK